MAKKSATAPTKSQIIGAIADQTELTKKQVAGVFDALNGVMKKSLKNTSVVTATSGRCRSTVREVPARSTELSTG